MRPMSTALVVLLSTAGLAAPHLALACDPEPEIGPVVPVVDFDVDPTGEVEGIAISPQGDLYVGAPVEGEIFKVTKDGEVSVFADLAENDWDAFVLGLAVGGDGSVYAAVVGCGVLSANGVWRIDADGNSATLVMPIPTDACFAAAPNALAFDPDGNLYATESVGGAVWRLSRHGDATKWVQDDLLLPAPNYGANGIAYRNHSLWVLNTDAGSIVRVPILRNGSAGQPSTFVQSDLLTGIDGGQFDVAGNMYVGNVFTNNLLRVSRKGEVEIVIPTEQLNGEYWPTNPVFGFGHERSTLYISGADPSVVKVDVGIPGMLLPQFERRGRRR